MARQRTQQYLWNSHRPAAIRAGIREDVVNEIAAGHVSATYSRAVAKFGEEA